MQLGGRVARMNQAVSFMTGEKALSNNPESLTHNPNPNPNPNPNHNPKRGDLRSYEDLLALDGQVSAPYVSDHSDSNQSVREFTLVQS